MQPWKLTLAYDGTPYNGWQVQPGLPTVQGTLAAALRRITGETVLPQGSGRTDTGVHALAQVASFALEVPIPPPNLQRALNRALPPSIRVVNAEHAAQDFHARFSARGKTYEYRIFLRPQGEPDNELTRICPPWLAPYVWDCPWAVDPERAQRAAAAVVGEHDFSSFAAVDPDAAARDSEAQRSMVRRIDASGWQIDHVQGMELLVYRVTGSGFLHHMVRNLVGTFIEAAAGRLDPDAVAGILAARRRSAAGPTAPARGLYLAAVEYGR